MSRGTTIEFDQGEKVKQTTLFENPVEEEDIFEKSVNEVATLVEDVIEVEDSLWNALTGEYDIVLDSFENVEDGSEDLAFRLLGYFRRVWTGQTKREEREERERKNRGMKKIFSPITEEVGQDVKIVANYAEKNAIALSKTMVDTTKNTFLQLYDEGKEDVKEGVRDVSLLTEKEITTLAEKAVSSIEKTIESIESIESIDAHMSNIEERENKREEEEIATVKDWVWNSTTSIVNGIVDRLTTFIKQTKGWKVIEASPDFFYISCALLLLGKFDFLLKDTYALFFVSIILVYIIRFRT